MCRSGDELGGIGMRGVWRNKNGNERCCILEYAVKSLRDGSR